MPWVRIDDSMGTHPKIRALLREKRGEAAFTLHIQVIIQCAKDLTDGYVDKSLMEAAVPWHPLRLPPLVPLLVLHRVWDETLPGSLWRVHDYLDYNPSRDEVLLRRANDTKRQQRHRGHLHVVTP